MKAALLVVLLAPALAHAALTPANLRVEWLPEPLAVEAEKPRLSWRVEESDPAVRGQKQTAYRVLAATDLAALEKGSGDLWDTGKVPSDETLNIEYAGKPLTSGQQVFWKVRVWDKDGVESPWSAPKRWAMGLLKPEDWKAQWISFKDDTPLHADRSKLHLPPATYYRKVFGTKKELRRAMLYVSALGIVDMHINNTKVGDGYFESGWADYSKRAYYRAHDVTKLVQKNQNCIGAIVADGWYAGYVGYGLLVGYGPQKTGRNIYGKTPAVVAQLEMEFADGSRELIGTDATWQTATDGPIREADFLMGEAYDRRRYEDIWCESPNITSYIDYGGPTLTWKPAILAGHNGSTKAKFYEPGVEREVELGFQKPPKLAAYTAPPIRVIEELPAKKVTKRGDGTFIFDFGENFAGNIRLKFKGEPGQKLTLRYGEMLHPDGRLMIENLRKARATDTYICRGVGEETWTPRFTYHGFQYAELSGVTDAQGEPPLSTLTGLVLSNDTPYESSFACSDEVMTKFWKNTVRTQKANFIEIPTDCPQRDERLGWMGDAQLYARTAAYNADVAAFYTKWVDDIREAQRPSGAYPDYAPYPFAHGAPGATHAAGWTDAGIIVPYTMWQVYGDKRLIEKHWDSMVKFMDWRAKADPEFKGVKIGNTWGDWLNVNEDTPVEFIDLCYHAISADCMRQMAAALGRKETSDAYSRCKNSLRALYWDKSASKRTQLTVETQTAYVLALISQLDAPRPAKNLVKRIQANDYRMATGFLGTKPLLEVLTVTGHHDLACRLFQSRKFPSWGYEVEQGATSVWERWDSYTKEHGFNGATGKNNAAMNSFSHYAFGAVMEWAFQDLAGIRMNRLRLRFAPHVPSPLSNPDGKPLDWVRVEYMHPKGKIVSAWKRVGDAVHYEFTVPANTYAEFIPRPNVWGPSGTIVIVPPPREPKLIITSNGNPLGEAPGVDDLTNLGEPALMFRSGTYRFEVREEK